MTRWRLAMCFHSIAFQQARFSQTSLSRTARTTVSNYPLLRLARELLDTEPGGAYRRIISMVDEVVLQEALGYAKGNQLQAAALLGISRTTLRAKLRSMGLSIEKHLSNGRSRT